MCVCVLCVPFYFLPIEYLDGHFVSCKLMLCTLHFTKTTMTQCVSKYIPNDTHTLQIIFIIIFILNKIYKL